MEDFRSKSSGDLRMELQSYYGGRPTSSGPHDFRCYSASFASSVPQTQKSNREMKLKKGKNGGSSSKIWSFNYPEFQRKKRIASYKIYNVERKMKGSFKKSFRWLKSKYTQVLYGRR